MTFDKILDDNRLWAVRYDEESDNALHMVFNQWNDPEWLWDFFTENLSDLESYFKITELHNREEHASWLRLYAIKLEPGHYIITGGAIKLTRTMQERDHTLQELAKMEQVRKLLIEEGVVDAEGFEDYTNELYSNYK